QHPCRPGRPRPHGGARPGGAGRELTPTESGHGSEPTEDQMGEVIRVVCTCGAKLKAPASLAGRECECPRCLQPVLVPAAGVQAAAPPVGPTAKSTATREADWQESGPLPRRKRRRPRNYNVNNIHVSVGSSYGDGYPHPYGPLPNRAVAALLSQLIPGLGQFYRGQVVTRAPAGQRRGRVRTPDPAGTRSLATPPAWSWRRRTPGSRL